MGGRKGRGKKKRVGKRRKMCEGGAGGGGRGTSPSLEGCSDVVVVPPKRLVPLHAKLGGDGNDADGVAGVDQHHHGERIAAVAIAVGASHNTGAGARGTCNDAVVRLEGRVGRCCKVCQVKEQ